MIVKLIREFNILNELQSNMSAVHNQYLPAGPTDNEYLPADPTSLLIEAHGGTLIHRQIEAANVPDLAALKKISIRDTELLDCQQIGVGTYSPLTGFMDHETLESVLDKHRLPNGLAWPMPLLLQFHEAQIRGLATGERIALCDDIGEIHAVLSITEIYRLNLTGLAQRWFGSVSPDHPGVARLLAQGEWFVAGEVTLIVDRASLFQEYELIPRQTRIERVLPELNDIAQAMGYTT